MRGKRIFLIPEYRHFKIKNDLVKGKEVSLLIQKKDINSIDDKYISYYGIKSGKITYYSFSDFSTSDQKNNKLGVFLRYLLGIGLIIVSIGAFTIKGTT